MSATVGERANLIARCARCGTELAPTLLACPACKSLVHAERLRELASRADAATAAGNFADASLAWQQALELLPPTSQQHATISERVEAITRQLANGTAAPTSPPTPAAPWYRRGSTLAGAFLVLLLTKGKFLLLGLTKLKTFVSMFAFFGLYWTTYGWPLALGLVLTIYVHEMGHVAELKRLGIAAGAPLFIPGLGALILVKQRITDPSADARVGLAGPVWGLGAGLVALAVYLATRTPIWGAIAALTGWINLFNLTPVWQLDGSRAFHALARWQRWTIVAATAGTYYLTGQKLLFIVGAVALWRAFQKQDVKADRYAFVTYLLLLGVLSWLSVSHSIS